MLNAIRPSAVLTALLFVFSASDVASYNKYGRSCKDIGCPRSEVCVMAEDPCTIYSQDKCGRYPTCKKVNAEASCSSIICPDNDYCRTENGVPKCVSKVAPNVPYQKPSQREPYSPYPRVRPTPTIPSRKYGPGRSSGRSGSRNTIGDNSLWNRLFGNDRNHGYNSRLMNRIEPQQTGSNYYNTHMSTDKHGNRIWTFSG